MKKLSNIEAELKIALLIENPLTSVTLNEVLSNYGFFIAPWQEVF